VSRRAKAIYHQINTDGGPGIEMEEFGDFCCNETPVFLAYTYLLQKQMRKRIFGEAYWEALTKARAQTYQMDLVFQEKMKAFMKVEEKRKSNPKFAKEFPRIAANFKDEKAAKVRMRTRLAMHVRRAA
jgi:hypothetical protein